MNVPQLWGWLWTTHTQPSDACVTTTDPFQTVTWYNYMSSCAYLNATRFFKRHITANSNGPLQSNMMNDTLILNAWGCPFDTAKMDFKTCVEIKPIHHCIKCDSPAINRKCTTHRYSSSAQMSKAIWGATVKHWSTQSLSITGWELQQSLLIKHTHEHTHSGLMVIFPINLVIFTINLVS